MYPVPLSLLIALAGVAWFIATSFIAWHQFRTDKWRALEGLRRIPERDLLFIAMIGDWPGARLAQRRFRHKTRKEPFRSQLNTCAWPAGAILVTLVLLAASIGDRQVMVSGDLGRVVALLAGHDASPPPPLPRRFGPGS
ncbi:DUF1294 domain-containing protein [Xinfangfangia sp. D13-10-4-6]|uniref:DUF1294 domain-containing protein n=1 Tax=Pseudogemmobacter hezensis TaxID=2737662 RepID=UPI00155289A8|nr:DUF1294 domain-containing protein [Pseudogemmobacter hezensis]NPD14212.1 DUF1294 domain-containing protein [Pseudogemmobacter hezensis]